MNNLQGTEILRNLPAELHDITVVTTDGTNATADVVYSRGGGDLYQQRVEFKFGKFSVLDAPEDFPAALYEEVIGECVEACKYQRDLNRSKN